MGTIRHDRDERLPNSSIIYWSKRFKDHKGRWRIPVRCGSCGEERTINASSIDKSFSGLCNSCGKVNKIDNDEHLTNGSIVYWSRRFRHKGYWRVPVRCGGCGEEHMVSAAYARRKKFSGLCYNCGHSVKIDDERLSSGSVVFWSRRFKDREMHYRVPVRCGGCGEERTIDAGYASRDSFSGLCERCGKGLKTDDKTLPNGSVVYWSKRFKREGYWRVPVRCGGCGEERTTDASNARKAGFSGLCERCSGKARRKYATKTGVETLPDGSIIYWDDKIYKGKARAVRVRCGGPLCGGYTRYVEVARIQAKGFTGLCLRCSQYGPRGSRWKDGRMVIQSGYVLLWLPPDHPYRCMADKKGYVREHRLVMAEHLGRPLTSDEIVHHINGNKRDNRIENLELLTKAGFYAQVFHHAGYHLMELTKGERKDGESN